MPEPRWIGRSFGRAAGGYDALSGLQASSADALLRSLQARQLPAPDCLLDAGAGTGYPTRGLLALWPHARVLALDLALGMVQVARCRLQASGRVSFVCADAGQLPLAHESVDLIFSNMALQWCSDLPAVFSEWQRVLKPGGSIAFTTFGPGTLHELKAAWATVDHYTHVMNFENLAGIHQALNHPGWSGIELTSAHRLIAYPDVHALMRELKGIGAHNVTWGRPRHLLGKATLRRMIAAYPPAATGAGIQATFDVVSGFCSKAMATQKQVET